MAVRQKRVAQIILKSVSEMIQYELKDPDVGLVTVLDVDLNNDYSTAKVYVSFLDTDRSQEEQLAALSTHAKYIRGRLGKMLDMRKIPEIQFVLDTSYEQGKRIDDLIAQINKQDK